MRTLKLFFWNGHKLLLHIILLFLERLHKLKHILEAKQLRKYRFYSSSLLMVYEGATNRDTSGTLLSAAAAAEAAAALATTGKLPAASALTPPKNNGGATEDRAATLAAAQIAGKDHYPAAASLSSCSRLNDILDRSISFSGAGGSAGFPRSASIDFHNVLSSSTAATDNSHARLDAQSKTMSSPVTAPVAAPDDRVSAGPPRRGVSSAGSVPKHAQQQLHEGSLSPPHGAVSSGSKSVSPLPPVHPATVGATSDSSSSAGGVSGQPQHLDVEDLLELRQILFAEQSRIAEIQSGYSKLVEQKAREEKWEQNQREERYLAEAQAAAIAAAGSSANRALASSLPPVPELPTQEQSEQGSGDGGASGAPSHLTLHSDGTASNSGRDSASLPGGGSGGGRPNLSSTPNAVSSPSNLSSTTPSAASGAGSPGGSEHISYTHVNQAHPSPQPPSPFPVPSVGDAASAAGGGNNAAMLMSALTGSNIRPITSAGAGSPLPPQHPTPAASSSSAQHSPIVQLPPAGSMHPAPSAPASGGSGGLAPKLYNRVRKTTHAVARERARLKGNIDIRLIDYAQVVKLEHRIERPIVGDAAAASTADASSASSSSSSDDDDEEADGGAGDPGLLMGVTNLIYLISNIVQQEIAQMLIREGALPPNQIGAAATAQTGGSLGGSDAAAATEQQQQQSQQAFDARTPTPPLHSLVSGASSASPPVVSSSSVSPLRVPAVRSLGLPPGASSPLASSSHTAAFSSSHVPRKQLQMQATPMEPSAVTPLTINFDDPDVMLPPSAHSSQSPPQLSDRREQQQQR